VLFKSTVPSDITTIANIGRFTQGFADFFLIGDAIGCAGSGGAEFATLISAAKLTAYICCNAGITTGAIIEGSSISSRVLKVNVAFNFLCNRSRILRQLPSNAPKGHTVV